MSDYRTKIEELMAAQNHLIAHQNAAFDIMAADKRAAAIADLSEVALLCKNGEILEVMDYGDRIAPAWSDADNHYNPEMNICHESDELLEDGETIHGAFFEWDKTLPFGTQFDAPEAIAYFDGTEGAQTFHIDIAYNYGDGWKAGDSIQFTLSEAPAEGDQLVINLAVTSATDPTNGRPFNVYGKGSTTSKQSGTTSKGTGGTLLGSTDATSGQKTNGKINAPARAVYGYNRWSQSGIRQYLNGTGAAGTWWTAQNAWDRPHDLLASKAGFLNGYTEAAYRYFKPIKVVTVACDADSNVEDVTYDRVFLSSLEQMYVNPQFAGKEGEYWEYYKRLLGRTTPAAQYGTYTRLIKYALGTTSAQYCWRRSAFRSNAGNAWYVYSSGYVTNGHAVYAYRCAPSVFISD